MRRELLLQGARERIRVDLEADRQRCFRRDAGADASILLADDGVVQLQGVAPEGLASECVLVPNRTLPNCIVFEMFCIRFAAMRIVACDGAGQTWCY